jgi:hypothetical protein
MKSLTFLKLKHLPLLLALTVTSVSALEKTDITLPSNPDDGVVSLHLSAQTGLEGLTQREASVYYLRLSEQIHQSSALLTELSEASIPFQGLLDHTALKASKYQLSQHNKDTAITAEATIMGFVHQAKQIQAQIDAWERRQAFLLASYPIQAHIITLRNKFRLAPEQTSASYLDINIETKKHGNSR